MKTKKLLGVVIVLSITATAFAFSGKIPFNYAEFQRIIFASENEAVKLVGGDKTKIDEQRSKLLPSKQILETSVQKTGEETFEVPDKIVYL